MKERGILFQAPLVRAILAGSKTQTRRLVKPQPTRTLPNEQPLPSPSGDPWTIYRGKGWRWQKSKSKSLSAFAADEAGPNAFAASLAESSPYGVKGDRLWVREQWQTAKSLDKYNATQIAAQALGAGYLKPWAPLLYNADGERASWAHERDWGGVGRQRAARFMPRWASRITLEITEVRVERLQTMGDADAKAEGFVHDDLTKVETACGARDRFAIKWDEINGKRASWSSNPWVWVITFRRLP